MLGKTCRKTPPTGNSTNELRCLDSLRKEILHKIKLALQKGTKLQENSRDNKEQNAQVSSSRWIDRIYANFSLKWLLKVYCHLASKFLRAGVLENKNIVLEDPIICPASDHSDCRSSPREWLLMWQVFSQPRSANLYTSWHTYEGTRRNSFFFNPYLRFAFELMVASERWRAHLGGSFELSFCFNDLCLPSRCEPWRSTPIGAAPVWITPHLLRNPSRTTNQFLGFQEKVFWSGLWSQDLISFGSEKCQYTYLIEGDAFTIMVWQQRQIDFRLTCLLLRRSDLVVQYRAGVAYTSSSSRVCVEVESEANVQFVPPERGPELEYPRLFLALFQGMHSVSGLVFAYLQLHCFSQHYFPKRRLRNRFKHLVPVWDIVPNYFSSLYVALRPSTPWSVH